MNQLACLCANGRWAVADSHNAAAQADFSRGLPRRRRGEYRRT